MLTPPDSTLWAEFATLTGARLGRRVTLIDPGGRVRGDTEFDPLSLTTLENHRNRPEVRAALDSSRGVGVNQRLSASTNERLLYVAVRDGPPGLGVVRVSTSLAGVDAQVHALQRAGAVVGLVMLIAAALVAWLLGRVWARRSRRVATAGRDAGAGRRVEFPGGRGPEPGRQIDALRARPDELGSRFDELRREREESQTLLEARSDGVLAANQ